MKKTFISIAAILAALLLFGCNSSLPTGNNDQASIQNELFAYTNRLLELENKLLTLQSTQFENELEYLNEIKKLTNEVNSLREFIYSSSSPNEETNETISAGFLFIKDDQQITIIGYEGESRSVIIPATINGLPVRAIDDEAFKGLDITSVTIPDTVVSIGWFAFSDCSKLTRVSIPQSVTSIGYEAFSGSKSVVIYTYSGSYTEKYAKSYGIPLSIE